MCHKNSNQSIILSVHLCECQMKSAQLETFWLIGTSDGEHGDNTLSPTPTNHNPLDYISRRTLILGNRNKKNQLKAQLST